MASETEMESVRALSGFLMTKTVTEYEITSSFLLTRPAVRSSLPHRKYKDFIFPLQEAVYRCPFSLPPAL